MNRGRGRGRGPAGPRAVARDDDGNAIATQAAEGPPALFPEVALPPLPTDAELEAAAPLITSLHDLNSYFKHSPFNLGGIAPEARKPGAAEALAAVVSLDKTYFPEELGAPPDRSRAAGVQADYWAATRDQRQRLDLGDLEMGRMEELARREQQQQRAQDAGTARRPGAPGEEEPEAGAGGMGGGEDDPGADEEHDMDDAYEDAYQGYDDDDDGIDDEGGGDDAQY